VTHIPAILFAVAFLSVLGGTLVYRALRWLDSTDLDAAEREQELYG